MIKKTIFKLLLFILLLTATLFNPQKIRAQVGTNISNSDRYPEFRDVLKSYGVNTVTVLIDIGCAQDVGCLQTRKQDLASAGISTVVLRVSEGSSEESAISVDAAAKAGQAVAQVFGGYMVEFGNEVNNINFGWKGGTGQSYIDALAAFANNAGGVRVLAAALDPFFTSSSGFSADEFISQFYGPNAGRLGAVSGLAFNVYESGDWSTPCPIHPGVASRNTKCSWLWLAGVYAQNGMARGLRVITEYSLLPGKDGDFSKVIKFIDETKDQMLGLGASVITPLIKNQCQDEDNDPWAWLIFVNGNPSRIVNPNSTDMSTRVCTAEGGEGGGCSLASVGTSVSGTGIFGFLSGLLSFFSNLLPTPPELPSAYVDAFGMFMIDDHDLKDKGRPLQALIANNPGSREIGTMVIPQHGSSHEVVPFDFFGLLPGPDLTRNNQGVGWTQDFNLDSTTPNSENLDCMNTLTCYLGGDDSPSHRGFLAGYPSTPDDQKDDTEIMKRAGVRDKLWPKDCRDPDTLEWYDCNLVDSNQKMRKVMRFYASSLPDNQVDGNLEKCNDEPVGCVVSAPGGRSWFDLSGSDPSCSSGRPLMVSEFCCTNENCSVPPDVSKSEIQQVCQKLGIALDGTLSTDGLFYSKFGAARALQTPGHDALYAANGPYYQLKGYCNDLLPMGDFVSDGINQIEADPRMSNQAVIAVTTHGLAGVSSVQYEARKGARAFESYEQSASRFNREVPDFSCPAPDGGDDTYLQAIAGAQNMQGYCPPGETCANPKGYTPAKCVGGCPDEQQVRGVSSDQGQVLQTSTANQPDPSEKPKKKTITFNRSGDITVPIPAYLAQANWSLQDIAYAILPKETVDDLNTKVDGVKVAELPTSMIQYCKGDMSCDPDAKVPYNLGAMILAKPGKSVISDAVLPFDPNKQATVSRWVHEMAKGNTTINPYAKISPYDPFSDLQSLNTQAKELSLKK